MRALNDFLNKWDDQPSLARLRASDKSVEVHRAEIYNHLKEMAMKFERSPGQHVLELWAKDIAYRGYRSDMVKDICGSIPFKFEKHPALSQIMELLRPYLPQVSETRDEMYDLSIKCYPHLKAKFIGLTDEGTFNKMVDYYLSKEPGLKQYGRMFHEICMLNDWLRTYFKDGQAIMNQQLKTQELCEKRDRETLTSALRRYAKENNL
jgi:hypothetical protein